MLYLGLEREKRLVVPALQSVNLVMATLETTSRWVQRRARRSFVVSRVRNLERRLRNLTGT